LHILKLIEDGKLDQHTGSFEVGKLLKTIYIDSALKKADHINSAREHADKSKEKDKSARSAPVLPPKKISWTEFKKTHAHVASHDATKTENK
jgi:hypothetical protein